MKDACNKVENDGIGHRTMYFDTVFSSGLS